MFSQPQPNALADILGTTVNHSAPGGAGGISQDDMEAAAKARGYDSYQHMIYSMQHRLPPPQQGNGGAAAPASGNGVMNVLHSILAAPRAALGQAFAWHPANTLGRVNDAFAGINGGQ